MSQSAKKQERQEAIKRLREWIKPGDTIYTILRHVSRSGMQREVSLYKIDSDAERELHGRVPNSLWSLDGNVAAALGDRIGKHYGVIVGGCGTDVGFELVYNLGRVLWPDGFGCVGEQCHSNDHSNGDRSHQRHTLDDSGQGFRHWHDDGGYALQQRWL